MNYSYWELKQYFSRFDLIVIGAGIVGLNAAIAWRRKNPRARVLILERGIFPNGASTKNAGFACFGSVSELADDLEHNSPETVWDTVRMRWEGLALLRDRLSDRHIRYESLGGYELFDDKTAFERCLSYSQGLNKELEQRIGLKECYSAVKRNRFGFRGVHGLLLNRYEGQIDTGRMMERLTALAHSLGILTLCGVEVRTINDAGTHVEIDSSVGLFSASRVIVATNGFATQLLNIADLRPARAQVLVTSPIPGLKIKGAFHYDRGYYYFRNVDGRVLFGGGRNLDPGGETTAINELNETIQVRLDGLLKTMILPETPFQVEQRWTGIMGLGSEKKPIIRNFSPNVVAAVRMGGMGIAIGSLVGDQAAELV